MSSSRFSGFDHSAEAFDYGVDKGVVVVVVLVGGGGDDASTSASVSVSSYSVGAASGSIWFSYAAMMYVMCC